MKLQKYLTEEWKGVKQWHEPHVKRGKKKEPMPEGWWYPEMWNDYILNDCKPYLRLMKKSGMDEPLFRGIDRQGGIMDNEIHMYSVRKNRRPKGMNISRYKKFNEWLERNGHVRRDKAVITTPLKSLAQEHAVARHIWPMGKFRYTFILGATDINVPTEITLKHHEKVSDYHPNMIETIEAMGSRMMTDLDKKYLEWLEKNTYSNNFRLGVRSGSEIWIQCEEYYITSIAAWDGLKEFYKKS